MGEDATRNDAAIDGIIAEGKGRLKVSRDERASVVVNRGDVDSVDAALARIQAAGGEALTPKLPIPGVGFMFYARDTEGNVLGVFQEDASAH